MTIFAMNASRSVDSKPPKPLHRFWLMSGCVLTAHWSHCTTDFPQIGVPWFPFTDHPSISEQLGRPSAWFRGFISETDVISFLFLWKCTHGVMHRMCAFRKHVIEVPSVLLHANKHVFRRYVIAFNVLHSLSISRFLESDPQMEL